MIFRNLTAAFSAAAILLCFSAHVFADGPAAAAQTKPADMTEGIAAECVYVCETETGTVLCEQNADEQRAMGHMAKLMTALIAAEDIEAGTLSLDDIAVVTSHANSKQGTQIWLDVGEKISVEELIKSITVGNANDGCTALAEKISGSEEAFIKRMNKRAERLGMKNTSFADCCGTDPSTVSTARDIALLSSELVKHDDFTEYYTTWIDRVRNESVELVSTNRLIRTYKGIQGLKACSSEKSGECVSVCAKRGDMDVCVVLLGCSDGEARFTCARDLLDRSFENFRIYMPEIDKKYLGKMKVNGGEFPEVSVKLDGLTKLVTRAGEQSGIEAVCSLPESVEAPVKKGDVIGRIDYVNGEETLLTVDIVAAEDVGVMDLKCSFKKCLANLLNMKR